MRRRPVFVIWLIIIGAVLALVLTWQYAEFRTASRTLPAGMTIAGLPVEGQTREEAFGALETSFAQPLELAYQDQRLLLPPDSIELRYSAEGTAANLDAELAARGGFDGFVAHLLRRPPEPVDVAAAVSYSEERLDGFLARVVNQYDRPPQEPVPVSAGLTFSTGQAGYELDIPASRARLSAAIVSAVDREVELVVRTEDAPPLRIEMLAQLLESLADNHPGLVAGVFVKDMQTGDEVTINADVAYAGLSVLKIAVLEETYRILEAPLGPEHSDWMSDTLGETSSNFKANLLLRDVIGGGSGFQGAENLTASLNRLGLVNTFMVAPYDEEGALTIVTPANSRTDVTTVPDPYMQTTPLDIGLLLEMVYQCSQGGGALMVAYPGAFTTDECAEMIEWMTKNAFDNLIEAGLPEGTRVAHKHGFAGDTHADAALVFSPGGDFVLVIFLYRPDWLEWEESSGLVADMATATYNYFNPDRE